MHYKSAHEFAIYLQNFNQESCKAGELYIIEQKEVVHRISRVLRLHQYDNIILFDAYVHAYGYVFVIDKQRVTIEITDVFANKQLLPFITVCLPMLKREAFEQAVYSAVELGANAIQPILTEKMQRCWKKHDKERMEHIAIAAAEQSKHFNIIQIHNPIALRDLKFDEFSIFFDSHGQKAANLLQTLLEIKPERLYLIVGPEGDLTDVEKYYLQSMQTYFLRLTPTVLRSPQALGVGLGLMRSCL